MYKIFTMDSASCASRKKEELREELAFGSISCGLHPHYSTSFNLCIVLRVGVIPLVTSEETGSKIVLLVMRLSSDFD